MRDSRIFTYLYSFSNSAEEIERAYFLLDFEGREEIEVSRHDAILDSLYGSLLEAVCKVHKLIVSVKLAAFSESARPREDRSDTVRGGLFPCKMLVVVALNRTVSSLVLIVSVGRNEHGGHHCKASVSGRNHVAHYVAVVVLARPDVSATAAYHASYSVVDEGVEVLDARLVKLSLILVLEDLSPNVLESVVVDLGDRILGGEPYALLCVKCVVEAAAGEACDRCVYVVNTLDALQLVTARVNSWLMRHWRKSSLRTDKWPSAMPIL